MLNKVMLIGNLGADPEIKDFPENGNMVATFNMATTKKGFKTKDGREIADSTQWHRIVVWGPLAKVIQSYVKKGSKIFVEGELRHRDYTDTAGVKRFISEIYVESLELLDARPAGGAIPPPPPPDAQNTPATGQTAPPQQANTGPTEFVGPDGILIDPLPF